MIVSKTAEFLYSGASDSQIENFCNEIISQNPEHVFLTILRETYPFDQRCNTIDEFMYARGIPTTWIVTNWSSTFAEWKQLKCPVFFVDYFMLRSYNEIIVKRKSGSNANWNPDATRYLFLTGKPAKRHRIGLLYKLHSQQLLEQCDHSLFMSERMIADSKKFVPELTDAEFANFVQQYTNTPDDILPVMHESSMHYGGIPYDCKIYANSLFRLVSETTMYSTTFPWLTEKTWLTIVNKNPFVIAGDRLSCKLLSDLGFQTFDNMFDIPSYDDVLPYNDRLNSVVEHVKQWLAGNFNKNEVADKVEHNYKQLLKLSIEIKDTFNTTTGYNIDDVVSTNDGITGF